MIFVALLMLGLNSTINIFSSQRDTLEKTSPLLLFSCRNKLCSEAPRCVTPRANSLTATSKDTPRQDALKEKGTPQKGPSNRDCLFEIESE